MAQLSAEENGLVLLCAGGLFTNVSPLLTKPLLPPTAAPPRGRFLGW